MLTVNLTAAGACFLAIWEPNETVDLRIGEVNIAKWGR